MENFHCSGWFEAGDFSHSQSQMTAGYSSSVPALQATDDTDMFSSFQLQGLPSYWSGFEDGFEDGRAAAAASSSKSHTEAEKRRRDRINGHLLTLRKLVPKSDKMDKAALLACVIQHVKGLQSEAAEVGKALTVPTDVDEVRISSYAAAAESTCGSETDIFMEASLCCEDRPELFAEIDQALQSLNLSTARVEMGSLGGRVRIILLLSSNGIRNDSCGGTQNRNSGMINLKGSLNVALNRIVNSTPSVSSYRVSSKRQRFFLPSDNQH